MFYVSSMHKSSFKNFKLLLSYISPASTGAGVLIGFTKVITGVINYVCMLSDPKQLNSAAKIVFNCIEVIMIECALFQSHFLVY